MKPVFAIGDGDCLRACICSLLEIPKEDSVHIYNFAKDKKYPQKLYKFLYKHGYKLISSKYSNDISIAQEYYMVWGMSNRNVYHSVIYYKGKMVHDPNREGGGVVPDVYVLLENI
jgi:hypothetical protein